MLISTKDAGGIAPAPLHATWPEAQSAVSQVNFPEASVVHRVRAQNRPIHGAWTSTDEDALDASSNPVVDS
jgi:hypothetical protein